VNSENLPREEVEALLKEWAAEYGYKLDEYLDNYRRPDESE